MKYEIVNIQTLYNCASVEYRKNSVNYTTYVSTGDNTAQDIVKLHKGAKWRDALRTYVFALEKWDEEILARLAGLLNEPEKPKWCKTLSFRELRPGEQFDKKGKLVITTEKLNEVKITPSLYAKPVTLTDKAILEVDDLRSELTKLALLEAYGCPSCVNIYDPEETEKEQQTAEYLATENPSLPWCDYKPQKQATVPKFNGWQMWGK